MDYETFKLSGVDVADVQTAIGAYWSDDPIPGRTFCDNNLYIERRPGNQWYILIIQDEYEGDLDTVLRPLYQYAIDEGFIDPDETPTLQDYLQMLKFDATAYYLERHDEHDMLATDYNAPVFAQLRPLLYRALNTAQAAPDVPYAQVYADLAPTIGRQLITWWRA